MSFFYLLLRDDVGMNISVINSDDLFKLIVRQAQSATIEGNRNASVIHGNGWLRVTMKFRFTFMMHFDVHQLLSLSVVARSSAI